MGVKNVVAEGPAAQVDATTRRPLTGVCGGGGRGGAWGSLGGVYAAATGEKPGGGGGGRGIACVRCTVHTPLLTHLALCAARALACCS
jgi:hypothetical protein